MEILSSLEARWFIDDLEGASAKAAREWFERVEVQGKRADRYLLTGRDDIGFKARVEEGRPAKIEIKYLLDSLGATPVHDGFVGTLERWQKLSLTVTDDALEKQGEWVRIAKARRLRKFAYDHGVVRPAAADALPEAGCGVELTELDYEVFGTKKRALTLGVEAFGPKHLLLEVFQRVGEVAFEDARGLRLGEDRSESYPAWLTRVGSTRTLSSLQGASE